MNLSIKALDDPFITPQCAEWCQNIKYSIENNFEVEMAIGITIVGLALSLSIIIRDRSEKLMAHPMITEELLLTVHNGLIFFGMVVAFGTAALFVIKRRFG